MFVSRIPKRELKVIAHPERVRRDIGIPKRELKVYWALGDYKYERTTGIPKRELKAIKCRDKKIRLGMESRKGS